MARSLRIEYENAFYHITSRGNERKNIFKKDSDREQFIAYLASAAERYNAVIHVYCLMNNHYHLLLETPSANMPQIMRHINGAYTTYFNLTHKRSGHLFQGRYKSILVEKDVYAKELSRYIHLNPVRAKIVAKAEAYPWSSCSHYFGKKKKANWLFDKFILSYFSDNPEEYKRFVDQGIKKDITNPFDGVIGSVLLGSEEFVEKIKLKYLSKNTDRDIPAIRKLINRPSLNYINQIVSGNCLENIDVAKRIILYLAHKYSGEPLKQIGELFGISESGVSQASRRVEKQMTIDKDLEKKINEIKKYLSIV